LRVARRALLQQNRQKALLREWFATEAGCNQKEWVGMSKALLNMRPSASPQQCSLLLDAMRFVVRTGLHRNLQEEVGDLTPLWDKTFLAAWTHMEESNMDAQQFFNIDGSILHFITDMTDVAAIMQEQGSWS
jgi:hypothetical protein